MALRQDSMAQREVWDSPPITGGRTLWAIASRRALPGAPQTSQHADEGLHENRRKLRAGISPDSCVLQTPSR